jgi:hypothetical protein
MTHGFQKLGPGRPVAKRRASRAPPTYIAFASSWSKNVLNAGIARSD